MIKHPVVSFELVVNRRNVMGAKHVWFLLVLSLFAATLTQKLKQIKYALNDHRERDDQRKRKAMIKSRPLHHMFAVCWMRGLGSLDSIQLSHMNTHNERILSVYLLCV